MSVRVVAPCRLHFGLLHVPIPGLTHWPDGTPVRQFGGVGLMVESPAVTVEIRRSSEWSAIGSLAGRALAFVKLIWERVPQLHYRTGAFHVTAEGPPEHIGLGVGTSLGMAVAHALFREIDWPIPDPPIGLARLAGRGLRSGIGVHGAWSGGLLVDGGKENDTNIAPHVDRVALPSTWRVVLVRPSLQSEWHGEREIAAFDRPRDPTSAFATTSRLCEIVYGELLPAARAGDFIGFSSAVRGYNRVAGEPFTADQGGPYSSSEVGSVIEKLLSRSFKGVGQSSWGPTVFAFAEDDNSAQAILTILRQDGIEAIVSPINESGQLVTHAEVKHIRYGQVPRE
jgi:beta-ribofuranosylaminobenzene 5'-phosphate synthase